MVDVVHRHHRTFSFSSASSSISSSALLLLCFFLHFHRSRNVCQQRMLETKLVLYFIAGGAMAAYHHHRHHLYRHINKCGHPPQAAVAVAFHFTLVALAEFFDSLGNAPETYHHRFANVLIVNGLKYYYCSSQIHPADTNTFGLYCLYYFKRRHRRMELPDIVKDFSTADLKGNEDTILRSDC